MYASYEQILLQMYRYLDTNFHKAFATFFYDVYFGMGFSINVSFYCRAETLLVKFASVLLKVFSCPLCLIIIVCFFSSDGCSCD